MSSPSAHPSVRLSFFFLFSLLVSLSFFSFFFFNDTATTEIYTLSLHDALPIFAVVQALEQTFEPRDVEGIVETLPKRSEEHTSELQSQSNLVCRLLLEKKKKRHAHEINYPRPR